MERKQEIVRLCVCSSVSSVCRELEVPNHHSVGTGVKKLRN